MAVGRGRNLTRKSEPLEFPSEFLRREISYALEKRSTAEGGYSEFQSGEWRWIIVVAQP